MISLRSQVTNKVVAMENVGKTRLRIDWMAPREIRAFKTYYVGPTHDPAVIRLASMETRESGCSLSDYRQLPEKVYIDKC